MWIMVRVSAVRGCVGHMTWYVRHTDRRFHKRPYSILETFFSHTNWRELGQETEFGWWAVGFGSLTLSKGRKSMISSEEEVVVVGQRQGWAPNRDSTDMHTYTCLA